MIIWSVFWYFYSLTSASSLQATLHRGGLPVSNAPQGARHEERLLEDYSTVTSIIKPWESGIVITVFYICRLDWQSSVRRTRRTWRTGQHSILQVDDSITTITISQRYPLDINIIIIMNSKGSLDKKHPFNTDTSILRPLGQKGIKINLLDTATSGLSGHITWGYCMGVGQAILLTGSSP